MKAFFKEQILFPLILALFSVPTILSKLSDEPNILFHKLEITMRLWEPVLLFILLGYLHYIQNLRSQKISSELIKNKEVFDLNLYNNRKERILNWQRRISELEIHVKEQNDDECNARYHSLMAELSHFVTEEELISLTKSHHGGILVSRYGYNKFINYYYSSQFVTLINVCLTNRREMEFYLMIYFFSY